MKRFLCALLAFAMLATTLAGCGNEAAEQPSDSGSGGNVFDDLLDPNAEQSSVIETGVIAKEVTIANADPVSMMPLRVTGDGRNVLTSLYEPLIDIDGSGGEIYGVLAKNWYFDGDDLHVEIYDYIHDSEGHHITAEDVIYSYDTTWNEGYTSAKTYTYCDSLEAVGDYEVVFHMKPERVDTFTGWQNMLITQYIFSKEAYENSDDGLATHSCGTGPYVLTEFTTGSHCVIEKYDDYWQTDESLIAPQHKANVETITYRFISDAVQVVNALKTGEIDYSEDISVEALPEFLNSDEFEVHQLLDAHAFTLIPNCYEGTPFSDKNLRAALFYAINVDDIITILGDDVASKLLNYGVVQYEDYYPAEDPDSFYNTVDIERAKEFLAASDYSGETVSIWYEAGRYKSYYEAVSLIIASAMDEIGIKYEIKTTDSGASDDLIRPVSADWDLVIINKGGDGYLLDFLRNYFDTTVYEGGVGKWFDSELDALFTKTYSNSGNTTENIHEIWDYIEDNYYVYGLFQIIQHEVYRSSLVSDVSVKNYRNWIIPGAWQYVG